MKSFLSFCLVVGCGVVFASDAFQCEMNLPSGKRLRVHFDSAVPLLTETTLSRNHRGEVIVDSVLTVLGPNQVCGLATDFAKSCQKSEIHEGKDFNYSFRCDEAFGDLFFLNNDGYSEFRCMGDNVSASYEQRIYQNCELTH